MITEKSSTATVHPTAIIERNVVLKNNAKVWHFCHIRNGAVINEDVSLGRDVFIDENVEIGAGSRVQNGVSIYRGVQILPYVFVGPHVIFTNDRAPRVNKKNWKIVPTVLNTGCSIGAGSIIRCGTVIGAFAVVGAGSVVTKSIAPFTLAIGLPARPIKKVCACAETQYDLDVEMQSPFCELCDTNLEKDMLTAAQKEFERSQNGN